MIESIFFNPWIWIMGILLVIAITGLIVVARIHRRRRGDDLIWPMMVYMVGGLFVAMALPAYVGWMLVPYDASFYQTYRITGEVEQIESAFNGEEGTMSQVFIARVDGVDSFIRSDDQRFRSLEVGDEVNLVCSKEFRYFQEPWFECSFGGAS